VILLDLHLLDVAGEDVVIERPVAAGARAYVTEPIDVRRLLAVVDENLPRAEA
jgi:AmiR/NasT family two-component response regulator